MRPIFAILLSTLLCLFPQSALHAQEQGGALRALARVVTQDSRVELGRKRAVIDLSLSQPVPWRVFTLENPARLVLDFNEVDWSGVSAPDLLEDAPERLRFGAFRPGWSRLVLDLPGPFAVQQAGMNTETGTRVRIELKQVSAAAFAAASGGPAARGVSGAAFPAPVALPEGVHAKTRQDGSRPLVVVLDPGHGGVDPGAQKDGVSEKDIVLTFARELKSRLVRDGGMEVYLTREDDVFVPLQARVSHARAVEADVFISLHADALAHGKAEGTTVYTLSKRASDEASGLLAAAQDRSDLIAGLDLHDHDDAVAEVLMDLARHETQVRSEMLAGEMVQGITGALGRMHKRPHLQAGFSVLRAPDIPSVLVELGFVSSKSDLAKIRDPKWRDSLAEGILAALELWAIEDAAAARLVRQ